MPESRSIEALKRLTDCLLAFGVDSLANINRLVGQCGQELGAICAMYNRLDGDLLCSLGTWQAPESMPRSDSPQGHICYDVICQGTDRPLVIRNLAESTYAHSDPNVRAYGLQTYIGLAVKSRGRSVGSLCVVYQQDVEPLSWQLDYLRLAGYALAVEEERRQELDSCRQREELFRMLVENQRDLVVKTDAAGILLYVNPAYCRMFGKSAEELIGTSYTPLVHPDDLPRVTAAVDDLFHPPYQCAYEERAKTSEGWRWLSWAARAILDSDGKVTAFIGNGRDISERKRIELSLRESEAKFRSMAEQTSDLISLTDNRGVVTYASPAVRELFGMEPEEMCGRVFTDFVDESMKALAFQAFREGQTGQRRSRGMELLLCRKDGSTFVGELNGARFDSLDYPGSLVVIRDITERKKAEAALLENQQRTQAMLDANPDLIFVFDAQGCIVDVKASRVEDLYRPPPEFLGRNFRETLPAEIADLTENKMIEARRDNKLVQYTYSMEMSDGRHEYESRLVPCANGNFVAVVRDVTDQKRVASELALSQEQLRLFVDANSDLMFLKDRNLRYLMVNQANADFFGRPVADIIGKGDEDFMPLDSARHCQISDRQSMTEKRLVTTLESVGERFFDVHKLPVIVKGEVMGVAGIIRDVTGRVQAERELQRSEKKFRAAFQTSPDSININRLADGLYLEANDGFCAIMGYSKEDVIGKTSLELNIWADTADRDRLKKLLESDGFAENMEARFRHKDGSLRIGLMSARLIDLYGEPCILSITRDITERRLAEEEKARLEAQLQQGKKMESIGRLAGGVAHDFNNMLGVILGHAEMAVEQLEPSHPVQADLLEIRKAGERSADLTRQLLAFARKQTISPKVLDPGETIAGMINMLKRLIGEDIQLIWKPDPDLWPVRVDPSQIDQILANLCVNARDAIAGVGTITIQAQNCHLDESFCRGKPAYRCGDFLKLTVSDSGCGMDKETLPKLFEPFFTTKELGKGTGLGLATVYGAIKQNEGIIDVVSEVGKGTVFTIYLPRYTGKLVRQDTPGEEKRRVPGRETILLVEDEPSILNMIAIMLERNGYKVIRARSPGEALELARGHQAEIDLLITDVVMPEMNGRDLAKNLLDLYPRICRLFMSGYTSDIIAHRGVLEHGVFFIQKPFTMKELIKTIRELLEKS